MSKNEHMQSILLQEQRIQDTFMITTNLDSTSLHNLCRMVAQMRILQFVLVIVSVYIRYALGGKRAYGGEGRARASKSSREHFSGQSITTSASNESASDRASIRDIEPYTFSGTGYSHSNLINIL